MANALLASMSGGGGSNGTGIPGSSDSSSSNGGGSMPQALQNLQRLLQSQLANVNPLQLQQAIQRQQVILLYTISISKDIIGNK